MKWTFIDRKIDGAKSGCIIREASLKETVVAIIPRPTRDSAGHERAREIAREIVLAHNDTEDGKLGGESVKCPHCHWGIAASHIDQHIREKHS